MKRGLLVVKRCIALAVLVRGTAKEEKLPPKGNRAVGSQETRLTPKIEVGLLAKA
jgi:hypothetical protein